MTIVKKTTREIIVEIGDIKPVYLICNLFFDYFGVEEIKVNINIKFE